MVRANFEDRAYTRLGCANQLILLMCRGKNGKYRLGYSECYIRLINQMRVLLVLDNVYFSFLNLI